MGHGAREIETTWASPERSSRAASRYWESAKIPWSYDLTEPEMQIRTRSDREEFVSMLRSRA